MTERVTLVATALLAFAVRQAAAVSAAVSAQSARFPFVVSYGGATNATSVAHFLDAPAGKHGFVRAKGGEFVTDAGPIRFNGTNLTGPANFPKHADADKLAARLSRLGINCVRLHYMDTWYKPFMPDGTRAQGILDDDTATQRKLSPSQLDKLDYLVAALKKAGIYVNMNLHVARMLDERDGVPAGSPWGNKTVGQFMPRLIELQKEYARDLLTHVNPYTGNAYTDEPAVAMIEISNEDPGLVQFGRGDRIRKLRRPFRDEVDRQWKEWKAKHGLAEKTTKRDYQRFLWHTEARYWQDMRNYIRKTLKARQPVSGTQANANYSPKAIQKTLDYVDSHGYFHHPVGVGGGWKKPGVTNEWTIGGVSLVHSMVKPSVLEEKIHVPGKPFTVSEYSHPFPNPFTGEGQPLACAYGRTKGWDGVFQYSYNHYPDNFEPDAMPWCIFDCLANPAVLVHFPACSAMMVRGDLHEDRGGTAGEFIWNRDCKGKEYVAVDAEHVKLFAGYADGREVRLGHVSLAVGETETGWAVVSLVSRYATGFGEKGKANILVAASGCAGNAGSKVVRVSATKVKITERGHAPVMAEGVPCRLTLPAAPGRVRCWALGPDGMRAAVVQPAPAADGAATILRLSPECRTLWYEVSIDGAE